MEKSDFSKTRNLGLQTIATKYMPATNTKGERIKAKASGGESHIHAWDYALSQARNYDVAAQALAMRLNWLDQDCTLHGGSNGFDFVYVLSY